MRNTVLRPIFDAGIISARKVWEQSRRQIFNAVLHPKAYHFKPIMYGDI